MQNEQILVMVSALKSEGVTFNANPLEVHTPCRTVRWKQPADCSGPNTTVSAYLLSHTSALSGSECGHAGVVGVIHKVVDPVDPTV